MTKYKCEKCGKEFNRKSSYDDHLSKKYPCSTGNNFKCDICGKKFRHKSSMYSHKKSHKVLETLTKNIKVKKVTNNNVDSLNVGVDKNIENVNVDGDVKVVKFGNENLSYMSDDVYKQILGRGLRAVQEFIEHSNFHPDHPENHNIYIANINDIYIVLFDGFKWSITDKDELMEDIIYLRSDYLIEKFSELKHEMDPRDVAKFEKFMKRRDDDDVLRKIKGELTLQFYNNRYLPKRIRRKMELLEDKALRDSVFNRNSKAVAEARKLLEGVEGHNIERVIQILENIK